MELLKIFSLGQGPQGKLGPPPTIRFLNKFQMIFVLDNKTQTYYVFVGSRFVADRNWVGFARKTALTISFVERGFERLGLDR